MRGGGRGGSWTAVASGTLAVLTLPSTSTPPPPPPPPPVSGIPLYVNAATGSDSYTSVQAGKAATPGATLGRAVWGSANKATPNANEAAAAGDTVVVSAGTYHHATGPNGRFDVLYQPVNAGAAGLPLRVQAAGTVVLTHGGSGPTIGSSTFDYIQWAGFTIAEATAPSHSDTGQVAFLGASHCSVESCVLTGNPAWTAREGDNYPAIRLEDASDIRIYNNTITDYGGDTSGAGDENHGGIETYRSYPVTIENNQFTNCASGIYMKAVNTFTLAVDTVLIRYNVFIDCRWGCRILRMPMTSATPMLIYQNIFRNGTNYGVWIQYFDHGTTDPLWIRVVNNTMACVDAGIASNSGFNPFQANSHHLWWNNIVYGGGVAVRMDTGDVATNVTKDRIDHEHNLYYGQTGAWGDIGGSGMSLATWQGTYGQDAASPAASASDPLFVNAGAADYHLQGASPALTLGRAVHAIGGTAGATIPAGAYITGTETIGLVA